MSLREKAQEVKAAGVAERGNFTPDGAPKRMYQYWLWKSNSRKAKDIRYGDRKENFCHFWRVVALWAPLLWTWKKVEAAGNYILATFGVLAVATLVVACILSTNVLVTVLWVLAIGVGIGLGTLGIVSGISAALTEDERDEADLMTSPKAITIGFLLGLPTALLSFAIVKGVKFYNRNLTDYNKPIGISTAVLAVAGLLTLIGLSGGLVTLLWVVGTFAGLVAVVAGVIIAGTFLSDYISGKRAVAREATNAYVAEHGEYPPEAEPGLVSRFFHGLGDFLILIGQVVRVKKWKICPIVEVK